MSISVIKFEANNITIMSCIGSLVLCILLLNLLFLDTFVESSVIYLEGFYLLILCSSTFLEDICIGAKCGMYTRDLEMDLH